MTLTTHDIRPFLDQQPSGSTPSVTGTSVPDDQVASRAAPRLPVPPTDVERDLYLRGQHRWLGPATFVGYLLIVISVAFFVGDHLWAVWLLVPLGFSAISTTTSLVTTLRRSRVTLAAHRATVDGWRPGRHPSVDVFLPSAGEDLLVLDNTFHHVGRLVWSGELTVYVLDDAHRPEVARLAAAHGFCYRSRPERGHFKKAGNLRYGFDHSSGDLIAIFDADFVPRPDFLLELAPYFDEPATAIVQSPQYFDVHPGMNWLQRAAGSTQVLFYRYVQPARDASGAAICVGTSALYRRSALNRSGGFAQIDHSEDVHTGVNLMEVGYEVRYVPTVVSKGICPDSYSQFVTQQYRWCNGSMSLLFSRRFHSLRLTRAQRLCYWSGFLFYVSTALDIITTALPPILMAFFAAGQVSVENYIFVMLALVVRQALIPFITSDGDSLVNLARVQTVYSFAHLVQIWDLVRGRQDGWVATGAAGSSSTARRIIRTGRVWLIGSQALMWVAIAWRTPEYGLGRYWPMIMFAVFNLYISFPIMTASAELPRVMRVGRRVLDTGRIRAAALT